MDALDVFNDDAFSLVALTAMANRQPVAPSQINQSKLFEEEGVNRLTVAFERGATGRLRMVEPSTRGGPGETTGRDTDDMIPFAGIHLQRDDAVMADEVQDVREFGTTDKVKTVENVVEGKVQKHTRDIDFTLEHHRMGAMKGIVYSAKGKVIANLYQRFNIAPQEPASLKLENTATNLREECEALRFKIEAILDGASYSGMWALCDNAFWLKLTNHKYCRDSYLHAAKLAEQLGKTADTFDVGGITFERYRMSRAAIKGNADTHFIAPGTARLVPRGVKDLFLTKFMPADYMETVNTKGLPRYAKQWRRADNKGVELQVQSNWLNICTLPEVLHEITL